MFTEEEILAEIINFLEYRKGVMSVPYVIVGEKFVDKLKNHYENLGFTTSAEKVYGENYKFSLTSAN